MTVSDDSPQGDPATSEPNAAEILAAVGEALYRWDIASDELSWSANAPDVLLISDRDAISTGRAYAQLLHDGSAPARFDAVMRAEQRDDGHGVFYRVVYGLRPATGGETLLWIEDTGRWFAGADGKPARALGTVRVVNDRYESERRLTYLARHDDLTGELNRHHLTQTLEKAIEDAVRFRSSCGFLLVGIDNLGRVNESYGYDVADEVIAAVAKRIRAPHARQGHARPLLQQQVRHRADRLHARRHDHRRRAADRRRARRIGADRRRAGRGDGHHRRRHARRAMPAP